MSLLWAGRVYIKMSVGLLEGLIWFLMPLMVTWLMSFVFNIFDREFQTSYYLIALLIGLFLLSFGPRCLCVDPIEAIFGSLLYSFVFSVLSMFLFLGVRRFFKK